MQPFLTTVEVSRVYNYTPMAIRPLLTKEIFPLRIFLDDSLFEVQGEEAFMERLQEEIARLREEVQQELVERGLDLEMADILICNEVAHRSKPYPPRGVEVGESVSSIEHYLRSFVYAHCSHKPQFLKLLLDRLGIEGRVIDYQDIQGWGHSFLEAKVKGEYQIFCPTFNMFLPFNIDQIIDDPYRRRYVLYLYSKEFYATAQVGEYEEFYQSIVDEQEHVSYRYNREWFARLGLYPFVPPIYEFVCEGEVLYDVRGDSRFRFVP